MLTKTNANKLLVSILLIAILCAPMVTMAFANPDEKSKEADDGQMLIAPAPEDEPAPASDENPLLIQQRDGDTNQTDSSTTPTEGQSQDEPNLISTNTASDNTLLVAGTIALVAAIALAASFVVVRHKK
jgi:uncharacterized protein HemX